MNKNYVLAHLRLALREVENNLSEFPDYTAQHLADLIRKIDAHA